MNSPLPLNDVKAHAKYYLDYYRWSGSPNIKKFEFRRTKAAIYLAGLCYRMQKRKVTP